MPGERSPERGKRLNFIRRTGAFLLCLFILAIPAFCRAQDASKIASPLYTKAEVIQKINAKSRNLKSLSGRFQQKKSTRLLVNALESQGTFQLKTPARFRWETQKPEPFEVVVNEELILIRHPASKQVKVHRHPTGKNLLQEMIGMENQEAFEKAYDLKIMPPAPDDSQKGNYIRLLIEPRSEKQSRYWQSIEVLVDTESWLPVGLNIHEVKGDTTAVSLFDLVENDPIQESLFEIPKTEVPDPKSGRRYD
jgi:outer membrane lipoprotein-sorting protein